MIRFAWMLVLMSFLFAGCAPAAVPAPAAQPAEPAVLTVMTHDSFAVSEEVVRAFEETHQVKVIFLKSGDSGSALNRAILTKANPQADVFYGVDNTFLSRALKEDIFEPYASPLLEKIPAEFRADAQNRALPVDFGDVCLNYDIAALKAKGLAVPQSLDDLIRPEYRGLLVVENPAVSSPGLAFLLATVAQYGEEGYLEYWKKLRANETAVVSDWTTAYYTHFSGSSGKGPQPLVVSYASSPAAEVVFADPPVDEAITGSVTAAGTCFRQIEFVGILKGTSNRALAEKFVDYMLSVPFQEDMPLQMFVYPVNSEAKLPEVFEKYAQQAQQSAQLDPERIAANRDAWIQAWDEAVLR